MPDYDGELTGAEMRKRIRDALAQPGRYCQALLAPDHRPCANRATHILNTPASRTPLCGRCAGRVMTAMAQEALESDHPEWIGMSSLTVEQVKD